MWKNTNIPSAFDKRPFFLLQHDKIQQEKMEL